MKVLTVEELKPNSLEPIMEAFDALKHYPVEQEILEMLINLIMCNETSAQKLYDKLIESGAWSLEAAKFRADKVLTVNIDIKVFIVLLYICDSAVGHIIFYCYYLQWWSKKHNTTIIDLDTFNMKVFPMGYPSNEELREVWDMQKVSAQPDNMIDHPIAFQSIL